MPIGDYGYNGLPKPFSFGNTASATDPNSALGMNYGMGSMAQQLDYLSDGNQSPVGVQGPNVGFTPTLFSSNNGSAGGIGSIRPPSQKAIDASRPGGLPDWMNWDNAGNLMQGIGALGSVWAGIQQNKLAKEALNFKKKSYSENMDFQKQSYNTALEDRIKSRASFTGSGDGYVSSYLDKNKL